MDHVENSKRLGKEQYLKVDAMYLLDPELEEQGDFQNFRKMSMRYVEMLAITLGPETAGTETNYRKKNLLIEDKLCHCTS
jgi:hypothetical protein